MMRPKLVIITSAVLMTVISGAVIFAVLMQPNDESSKLSNDASILDRQILDGIPKKDASAAYVERVGGSITPPTNSWISGLALQEKPLAVYLMPLSFQANDGGFDLGLPTISSSETVISGGHTPAVKAEVTDATGFKLTRFDKTSATLTYSSSSTELGKLTIAQGSPYVFYRAVSDTDIVISDTNGIRQSNDAYRFTRDEKEYVIAPHDSASAEISGARLDVSVPKGSLLTIYALTSSNSDDLVEFSKNEITSVEVDYSIENDKALTELEYKTENNQPTVVSILPYQNVKDGQTINSNFQSIYGDMHSYRGNNFVISAPKVVASNQLDLSVLSNDEKDKIINDLQADSLDISIEPQDTYFAGKQLARIANLLDIAKQLGQDEISKRLTSALKLELTTRLDGTYLYYDTELKGIAGQTAAFGSEDFNDHHFHYGYFIYAASILGRYDESFVNEYKGRVNLLVADIASYETYDEFPIMRNYDPYSGHSWAAGLAPFQDGNNQESSSEAINAWNGVALWAQVIKNKSLEQAAVWMLSNETSTANKAWRSVDTSPSYLSSYQSPVSALNFGGKRTYSTFFSDASNTKLGVQLIPMSPVMTVFSSDEQKITDKLSRQDKPGNYNVALGDYLLMYLALNDKDAAIEALEKQTSEFIDDGNSRTYMRAWVYTR